MGKAWAIGWFERLWWGSTATWLAGLWITRQRTQAMLDANPQSAPLAAWALPVYAVLIVSLVLLLWWLVARRASVAGKWLVVAAAALSGLRGISLILGYLQRTTHPASTAMAIVTVALTIAAAAMLFRDDARAWFGDFDVEDEA